jgi:hypothetical protein
MFRLSEYVGPSQPQCGKVSYIGREIPGVNFTRGIPSRWGHYGLSCAAVTDSLSRFHCSVSYKMAIK